MCGDRFLRLNVVWREVLVTVTPTHPLSPLRSCLLVRATTGLPFAERQGVVCEPLFVSLTYSQARSKPQYMFTAPAPLPLTVQTLSMLLFPPLTVHPPYGDSVTR